MSHHEHNETDSHDNSHGNGLGHIIPKSVYALVLGALIILTVITVAIAQVDFGNWNIIVAMLVSSVKATIVALFFMHLKYEDPFTWIYAVIPIFLLIVLIAGVFIDNPFRY
ncbi:MAG: cytochrome C oxidase subunit IV family protein [bacterium]|nr:cytochrome C oxidase subunit IV family protein [bacterium]